MTMHPSNRTAQPEPPKKRAERRQSLSDERGNGSRLSSGSDAPGDVPTAVLELQSLSGNRAVEQLMNGSERQQPNVNETHGAVQLVLKSGRGRPLEPALRAFMESRFGYDFARVRVHDYPQATESARALGALAYTAGQDIVFRDGQYAPESDAGRKLLAHELTHVVQQRGATAATQPATSGKLKTQNNASLEAEADSVSRLVAQGEQAAGMISGRVAGGAQTQLQKAPDPNAEKNVSTPPRGATNRPQPRIPPFPKDRLRDIYELMDELPVSPQAWVEMIGVGPREGPFVVGPFVLPTSIAGIKMEKTYGPYLMWAENGRTKSWMPAKEIPIGPSRLNEWWLWSSGVSLEVARRYPEDPAFVREKMSEQTSWEKLMGVRRNPSQRDVERRVEAGTELNRDIEIFMTEHGLPLGQALAETRKVHKEVLEVMILAATIIYASPIEAAESFKTPLRVRRLGRMSVPEGDGALPVKEALPTKEPPPSRGVKAKTMRRVPETGRPTSAKASARRLAQRESVSSSPKPTTEYVDRNPISKPDEIRYGKLLNQRAKAGKLGDIVEVYGASEIKGERSGDYRFIRRNGQEISADLYQPEGAKQRAPKDMARDIWNKSGQANIVVVELKQPNLKLPEAYQIARETFKTPDLTINRLIFIKDGNLILDISKR